MTELTALLTGPDPEQAEEAARLVDLIVEDNYEVAREVAYLIDHLRAPRPGDPPGPADVLRRVSVTRSGDDGSTDRQPQELSDLGSRRYRA
ncbi:hypothetical protein ACQPZX_12870 [Actinoplanes sp. CA-142083]|uniref:hypothetical protein n=1 Tax=Actinoplanes sp. CA-142083 TaxID=3239903 RepID=UPI003D8BE819